MYVIVLQSLLHPHAEKIVAFTSSVKAFTPPSDFEIYDCREVSELNGYQFYAKCSPFDQ